MNLSVFVLMLAGRSIVEVVIFSGQEDTYFGAASVTSLAGRIAVEDPDLFAAYRTAVTQPQVTAESLGRTFYTEMGKLVPPRLAGADWVDRKRLDDLATPVLIHDSVEAKGEQTLSKQQQSAILLFPLSYVPITVGGRLDEVVEKRRLANNIALLAVGF